MATGTAVCPYCVGDHKLVMKGEHIVSGPLMTALVELLRHRDESKDPQHEIRPGVVASIPAMRTIQIDGLDVDLPAGFRPAFVHDCPTSLQAVTLYADTEGGKVS